MHLLSAWILVAVLLQEVTELSREQDDTIELSSLENAWNEAHVRGDAEVLDRLWAEDFTVTVPHMEVMTKADAIGLWRSGRMKFERYQTSDIRIRVYGDAGVVTGRLLRTRRFNERVVEDDWRFTKVYVRRAGQWQVVAFHASAFGP